MTQSKFLTWSQHQRSGDDYANWHVSLESNLTLQILHKVGADLYAKDSNGATTLHILAKAANPRIMATLLLWTGPSLLFDSEDKCKRLAFHYAARSVEVTRMLLYFYKHNSVEYEDYFDVLVFDEPSDGTHVRIKNKMIERVSKELESRKYRRSRPDAVWDKDGYP